MKKIHTILCALSIVINAEAQDTFSICAVDVATGQVGSAGATCIASASLSAIIISDVHPGVGVVHTQSYWVPENQDSARAYMNAGYSPQQIIDSVTYYDVGGDSTIRQYGAVDLNGGLPRSAAFTGSNCFTYRNHITGPGYSIQGNILLGQQILDSMEARFLNTPGNLACKLMAALQGAKVPGADTRCMTAGISSYSAFLRVANPADAPNNLFLDLTVNTYPGGAEPIDSLQVLFNNAGGCSVGIREKEQSNGDGISVIVNAGDNIFEIAFGNTVLSEGCELRLLDVTGKTLQVILIPAGKVEYEMEIKNYPAGIYVVDAVTSKSKKHFTAKAPLN
jgi:uncharacterized Ntn-hydrolase superfamily protein